VLREVGISREKHSHNSLLVFRYVAFARDSGNIAAGVNNGARVIYGDGGKSALPPSCFLVQLSF
jgi:hypothetical protein